MTKAQAKRTLNNAGSTEAEKLEARGVLGVAVDGSEDSKVTGVTADDEKDTAGKPGDPGSQVGADNNMTASSVNEELAPKGTGQDSFPNDSSSLEKNKPSIVDSGAAAGAATAANRERFGGLERPPIPRPEPFIRRSNLTGEVDSVSSAPSAEPSAPDAVAPTQRYSDSRGYSNFRQVAAPVMQPLANVPVSDEVHYVGEDGTVLGSTIRGKELEQGNVMKIGGKEFVVVSGALGDNSNTVAVRQNLPQPIG